MNTLPGEFSVWEMCHDPREYAAQILLESRNALRMSLEEGPQLGTGFKEATVSAKTELARKRAGAYRHESERLTIVEAPTAMDALRNDWAKKQLAAQRKTNRWFGLALILMGLTILALAVLLIAAVQR